MIELPSGRQVSPYVLTTLVEGLPQLVQYRLVHAARDSLRVELVGIPSEMSAALDDCRKRILAALGEPCQVELRAVASLPRHAGGKHSVYVREW
jgi:hypothetical protein